MSTYKLLIWVVSLSVDSSRVCLTCRIFAVVVKGDSLLNEVYGWPHTVQDPDFQCRVLYKCTYSHPTHTHNTHARALAYAQVDKTWERERSGINGNIQRSIVTAVEILTRGHSEMYQKDTSKRPFPSKLFAMFAKLFIVVGRFVDSTHSAWEPLGPSDPASHERGNGCGRVQQRVATVHTTCTRLLQGGRQRSVCVSACFLNPSSLSLSICLHFSLLFLSLAYICNTHTHTHITTILSSTTKIRSTLLQTRITKIILSKPLKTWCLQLTNYEGVRSSNKNAFQ